jgi:ribulose-phosphate 3-epimerase
MKTMVAPSILTADFGNLQGSVEMINNSQADWLHLDIMDGVYVPNISFGFPVVQALQRLSAKPMDAHLMIVDPDRYITRFAECGVSNLTVHYEACTHLHRTVQTIRKAGMTAGVALNPHTPVSLLEEIISDIDLVLIMSVNPGFGGQSFISESYGKISRLRDLILAKNAKTLIEVDGGVNEETGRRLVANGADILVAGNYVMAAPNPAAAIEKLKNL